ncbi:2Fe-2S iron-sulfur cluster-binding protein [Zavarzinia compransoris]|uniref:2Fe-2S ferredoxin n=1 Tax=Zavarzinia compransoris TaxID=1264899 RepID=A0A317E4K9_9PROT|nr:2Fe-2S iron-sulfur cluster-binding protein [Zavarzinia compransoris]PWR21571.1 2Fe-2S ferredoxin [Zavarzinia compransoris]TDP45654.1 2Fe-2S ferredoxin [Zavarzinia compransoris]
MGKIIFVEHDGTVHEARLIEGQSLMQVATAHWVPGIGGDCSGACACGTCHVIVDDQWLPALGPQGDEEARMLSMSPERQPASRLACQIKLSAAMDGMTVRLPEFQM